MEIRELGERPEAAPRRDVVRQGGYELALASTEVELREAQVLRYRVFAEEMGARVGDPELRIEADALDRHCGHLLVRDAASRELAAYTRFLTPEGAVAAGGYYAESEFELAGLLASGRTLLEIGRTCVAPEHRSGAAITALWMGLARLVRLQDYDLMIGCASIPMSDGGGGALAASRRLSERALLDPSWRVTPRRPLPEGIVPAAAASLPPLLKAYVRLGAQVCGPPCWDPDFDTADLLIALDTRRIAARYAQHFLGRAA